MIEKACPQYCRLSENPPDGLSPESGPDERRVEAQVEIKKRDLSHAYSYLQIAELYKKHKKYDKALEWAEAGVKAFPKNTNPRLREFLADEYHREKRHDNAMNLVWMNFSERPGLNNYQTLKSHADKAGQWPQWREKAIAFIRDEISKSKNARSRFYWRTADHSLLVEILLREKKNEEAWKEAQSCGCDTGLWFKLTALREKDHPKDGHHPIIFMQCGPVRYRVDARKQAEKRPFAHRVIVRKTEFTIQKSSKEDPEPPIQSVYATIIDDDRVNEMILEDIIEAVKKRRSPVLLTERKDHLAYFAKKLGAIYPHVIVLKGGMGTKQRRAVAEELTKIPDDEPRIIVATGRYPGEGFDDARLDTPFPAMPISWRGTLAQYAGRLHRLHDNKKEVLIYDYADLNIPVLARMHERRLKGYRSIGYDISG
ncbi:MAG: hypothetical protein AB1742_12620 [bacterium]